jgi:hypothetical protein
LVKLKVSYENDSELEKFLLVLSSTLIKNLKLQPAKGKYRRAYIDLIDLQNVEITRED